MNANTGRSRSDRLERIERVVLGVVLMAATAWAVAGGHVAPSQAPAFETAASR